MNGYVTNNQHRHQAHLRSPYWAKVRLAVEERDHGRCTSCGETAADCELHVHHKSYTYWLRELEGLHTVTLQCADCHALKHRRIPSNRVMADDDLLEEVRKFCGG